MKVSSDTITAKEWLADSSITSGSRKNRRMMIQILVSSNGCETVEQLLDRIRNDSVTLYSVSKRLVDTMLKTHSIGTVYAYRSMLPGLWESILGENNFSRKAFDRLAPCGTVYPSIVKKIPTPDGVKSMLKMSNPQYRALVSGLAVSGMRIGEWLSRKMSDLEIRPDGYARVKLQAGETKARTDRFTFLTKEIVEFIDIYHQWLGMKSEYVFPGLNGSQSFQYGSALEGIKRLFARNGMTDDKDGIYSPHSFRTYADAQLRKSGMDSKYVSATIGHVNRLQSEIAYLDWREIENDWVSKCAERLIFFEKQSKNENRVSFNPQPNVIGFSFSVSS